MKKKTYSIDPALRPIMGDFLMHRVRDAHRLRLYLAKNNFLAMADIGHQLKGVGLPYGFKSLSTLGAKLEMIANSLSKTSSALELTKIKKLIIELEAFNESVSIRYKKSA